MIRARREQCGAALFGSSCFVQNKEGWVSLHPSDLRNLPQAEPGLQLDRRSWPKKHINAPQAALHLSSMPLAADATMVI